MSRPGPIAPRLATPGDTHGTAALRLVLQALGAHGCEPGRELAAVGLTLDHARDIEGRISRAAYCALWQRLAEVSGDPDCGLRLACRLPPGSLGVVEYVAANAATLRDGYAAVTRYGRLLHDAGRHELVVDEDGDDARFRYRAPSRPPSPRALLDCTHAYLLVAGRRATSTDFTPRQVRMPYPRPADTTALERFYRCPIAYGQRHCELSFDRAVLDLPVRRPDAQLARFMAELAERQLAHLEPTVASDPFLDRLRAAILGCLTRRLGPMLPATARELALSPRTLQRRLREQGLSFQGLVNEVRLGLAAAYLAKEELALGEIAFVLGYSEPSAFHRAFKRAFACTPAEYRGRHRATRR